MPRPFMNIRASTSCPNDDPRFAWLVTSALGGYLAWLLWHANRIPLMAISNAGVAPVFPGDRVPNAKMLGVLVSES